MVKPMKTQRQNRFETELKQAKIAIAQQDFDTAWTALQRAHMLSQQEAIAHTTTRWHMLSLAWKQRDFKEIRGQVIPTLLAFPLTLFVGKFRTQRGGKANTQSADQPSIPDDIRQPIER